METELCGHCRSALPPGGRPATITTKRYCSKRECQTARQREYRAATRYGADEQQIEDRPCFRCGKDLPARPRRVTDSEVGRWCRAAPCQRDRGIRTALLRRALDGTMTEQDVVASAHLFFEQRDRGRVDCPECGRRDGIQHYRHPKLNGEGMCKGLGNFPVAAYEIRLAHPDDE